MKNVETYGHISQGKLHIHHRQKFIDSFQTWSDCRVIVRVEKIYKKRSTRENAYYWSCIINEFKKGYEDTTGETISAEQAHEILKTELNYKELINDLTGEVIKVGRDTKSLTTTEFEEYLEKCRRFILEWFNIIVPMPNEQGELFK